MRDSSRTITAAIVFYLALTAINAGRHLWHDELYTYYIAAAPSWQHFWQDLRLDLNPPLEYLLARASISLFGQNEYAVRLPSILAFLAGSLCFYRFVSKRLGGSYGLLAMLVVWASPFFYYATEARPYALLLGFLGFALLAWDRASRTERGSADVMTLAMAIVGMMLSHMLAVVYILPFCLAESVRTFTRRKLDPLIWMALLLPCSLPLVYMRTMSRFEISSFPSNFQASIGRALGGYYGTMRLEAVPLLIAVLLALAVSFRGREKPIAPAGRLDRGDGAIIVGLLLIPLAVNIALMRLHAAYFDRYAIPVAFGYALLVVFALAAPDGESRLRPIIVSGVLVVFIAGFNLGPGRRQSVWAHGGNPIPSDHGRTLDRVNPELPLVAASGLTFLEMDHYGDAATVARLFYLTDRRAAIRYASATIFEGMPEVKQRFPIRASVAPYGSFVQEHPVFLVLATADYPEDWLLRALLDSRARLEYLGNFAGLYKDTQLYRVTMHD